MSNLKPILLAIGAVGGALGVIFGLTSLWASYGPCDLLDAFYVHEGRVVVSEHLYGGEEGVSGARLVAVDAATGAVVARMRADDRTLVGHFAGKAWLRSPRGLEARDPVTLAVVRSEDQLLTEFPALAALTDGEEQRGCLDAASETLRFEAKDGRNLAFHFSRGTLEPTESLGCNSRGVESFRVPLADGTAVTLRDVPQSSRDELVGPDGQPMGVSGLDLRFVSPESLGAALGGDVLVLRRAGTNTDAATELARVSVSEKREKWSAALAPTGVRAEHVVVVDGRIIFGDGARVIALDGATGHELWRRGRSP